MGRFVRYALLIIVVLAAAVGGVMYWRARQVEQGVQDIQSAVVERGTMLVAISVSGNIAPGRQVNLSFESAGKVDEVLVAVGDRVAAGDALARLDARQLTLQARQAQAAFALAEAQLLQLKEGAKAGEIAAAEADVRAAEAQLESAIAERDQLAAGPTDAQIAAAEAQVASAALQHRVTLLQHDQTIRESDDEKEKDQARYDLYAAEKALSAAETQLEDLLAGTDADALRAARANVAAATARLDAVQAQYDLLLLGVTEEQLTDAEAQVEQARAAWEIAELTVERAVLTAPFDGVVAAVNVNADEMVSAGAPAFTLLDADSFDLTLYVDEIDVCKLAVGQEARVTLDGLPDVELTGRVARIAPAATIEVGVVYYEATIRLAQADKLSSTEVPLRADMTASATIVVDELSDVLMAPTWVVRIDPITGQTYVHQRVDEEIVRVDVTVGVRHEGMVEIVEGLSEGDEVVWVQDAGLFGRP